MDELNPAQLARKVETLSGSTLYRLQALLEKEVGRRKDLFRSVAPVTLDQIPLRVQTRLALYGLVRRRRLCDIAEVGRLPLSEALVVLKPADVQTLKSVYPRQLEELKDRLAELNASFDLVGMVDPRTMGQETSPEVTASGRSSRRPASFPVDSGNE
ncbi:hypothetical protein [Larkinella soli]|uniref:hypothetical protein n=1 Tax=Larkinella soli TaxID=1770527 RepID=UPI000FFC1001|nr:hypothetical protein [Larkinella soli]